MNTQLQEQARGLLNSSQHAACYALLKSHWLENPNDLDCVKLLIELLEETGAVELSKKLKNLAEGESSLTHDPQKLFETGYQLIEDRQFDLAIMILTRCIELVPHDQTVAYELGFAHMSCSQHALAIPYFLKCMQPQADFDTLLNLCVCYICTRQPVKAEETLKTLAKQEMTDEQKIAFNQQQIVVSRLQELNVKANLNARDWLYIHYGCVLLDQSSLPGSQGKFDAVWNDYTSIASTILVLRGVLDGLGVNFEVIEFYSPLSRPLAQAIGELMQLPVEGYKGPQRQDRALLVMCWASDIIGPHESFTSHQNERSIFAYGLSSLESLPVTPDIAGCLSESCAMPWDEHWKVEEFSDGHPSKVEHIPASTESAQELAGKIMERVHQLESDPEIIHHIQDAVSYYSLKQRHLVLNNIEQFKQRPEYTAEVPL